MGFVCLCFLLGGYKGGGQMWKDGEVSGIGLPGMRFSKNQYKSYV